MFQALPQPIKFDEFVQWLPETSGYEPDVIVLDEPALIDEPDWESGSIILNICGMWV
jgi:hypothetical protein